LPLGFSGAAIGGRKMINHDLFPILALYEEGDNEINWHKIAELLRNRQFDQIPSYGWYIIADKIDPQPVKKGRRKRTHKQVLAVIAHFDKLRRDGELYENALELVGNEFCLSPKSIESILKERNALANMHAKAVIGAFKQGIDPEK
jgi:hypothetical protein